MRYRYARLLAGSLLVASVHSAWAQQAPVQPEAPIQFDITRFDVSGNTLLTQPEIDAAVAPYTGKGRDFGDVQKALEALEDAYRARGYNIVHVLLPEQELSGGVVRLAVQQTRIGRVRVTGAKYHDAANVQRSLPALKEGETPNVKRISSELKTANDNPSKKVTLKLHSGENDTADANLDVIDESPWKVMLNADNTGTSATGKTHVSAMLQNANLWGRDHVASFQYTTTAEKPSKVSVYGLGYHIPLYALGDSIDLFASYSDVDSGSVTAGIFNLAVSGKGSVFGARYNQVLANRDKLEQRLIYGLDVKAYKNSVLLGTQNFGNDVTVHPLSIAYLATQPTDTGEASGSFTLLHNLPGGHRGGSADFAAARAGAKAGYTVLRFGGSLVHATAGGWQLRTLLNGQWSGDALVPGEQFGMGGSTSVRGFAEREIASDSGLGVNLELYTPGLGAPDSGWSNRALAFVDAAHAVRNHVLPGEFTSTSIASVGLGWRLAYGSALSAQVDVGHVVQAGATASDGRTRVHFRVGLAY